MAVRTRAEYIESLRQQHPQQVYLNGKKVESVLDEPGFKKGIESIALAFDICHDPKYQELATLDSPLIGERISRWNHLNQSLEDALLRNQLMRTMGDYLVPCCYRCMTAAEAMAAWIISYDIDKKYGTSYHQRVVKIVKEVQKNDLVIGASLVDPKGDRSLPPSKQPDPDLFLHIVERRKDGIIVKGARAHDTAAPYTNLLCVMPMSRPLRENEKDYAVAFFTPVDTEGITYVCRAAPGPHEDSDIEHPFSSRYGGQAHAYTIYDNVFIPWERVFMCGEYEFVGQLMNLHGALDMVDVCSCHAAGMDLAAGALALVADCNGTAKAPHIREYLINVISNAEITYSCAIASAVRGYRHESGVWSPNPLPGEVGKVFSASHLGQNRYYMQEAAGGSARTMPQEADLKNPVTGELLYKYLKGRADLPAEHRIRALKLIQDLTASDFAGWHHAMCICEGGAPGGLRLGILGGYDLDKSKTKAKRAARIAE
ncbi:MAG: hypothetical protein HY670_07800 [Chloroflexi bacterium]|nr:hypothetical protein [Chloroflexota bacterium]